MEKKKICVRGTDEAATGPRALPHEEPPPARWRALTQKRGRRRKGQNNGNRKKVSNPTTPYTFWLRLDGMDVDTFSSDTRI